MHFVSNDGCNNPLAFSPDGRLLASTCEAETIVVWDTWTGQQVRRFPGQHCVGCLAFAPDGKSLASGGFDGNILIWDVSGILTAAKGPAENLSSEELVKCWDELAGSDAVRAYQVIGDLAQRPEQAVALLKESQKTDTERLPRLLAQLDDKNFTVRQKASSELASLGRLVEKALKSALKNDPSEEVKHRIEDLLERLEDGVENPEQLRLERAVEILERVGTPQARQLLETMAKERGQGEMVHEAKASLARLARRAAH
jgi:hypothetical protein